ncbi:hypothetical protein FSP39_013149 [Pinctada imbricata]|uniref:CCHC-type domain-containing protein n=1 Tax=Pinctada imbricata TaxID=66713 RepID=A0AA88XS16_PINIB|nr:hypothetical protein FSP39_013149 [Pinctada imbricata]
MLKKDPDDLEWKHFTKLNQLPLYEASLPLREYGQRRANIPGSIRRLTTSGELSVVKQTTTHRFLHCLFVIIGVRILRVQYPGLLHIFCSSQILVPQRQASITIPHDDLQRWMETDYVHTTCNVQCDRCGYGHFNNVCPASNKVCFICHKIGHFAKTCTQKAKSFKKTQRDKQRIQTFYQNVILRKEFPFANISNAALAQCMDLRSTLRTELKSVKCKLMKVKETYDREEQTLAENVKDINTKNCILEQTVR